MVELAVHCTCALVKRPLDTADQAFHAAGEFHGVDDRDPAFIEAERQLDASAPGAVPGNPVRHFRTQFHRCRVPTAGKQPHLLQLLFDVRRLIERPNTDTVLGLRDRAIMTILYGTGIRASECAGLTEQDIDWQEQTIHVVGKGGHERTVPLNEEVVHMLKQYRLARGSVKSTAPFFRSREGGALSRNAIYERVRTTGRKARIEKRVSPHQLRHTFATHLIKAGVGLVTVRDLLGHRLITSTQIYIHLTAQDLRQAAQRHPITDLIKRVEDLLPNVKLPFQSGTVARFG